MDNIERDEDVVAKLQERVAKLVDENKTLLMEKNQALDEKNKTIVEKTKAINEKSKLEEQMKKLSAALGSAVECPVCLLVPMEGTVPCCPSGHITCSPCLEGWRREGREECPTCRVPMGEGKSLLAKVVIENMEHECRMEGCKEMVAFKDYRRHQEACTYRLVICPSWGQDCPMVPF